MGKKGLIIIIIFAGLLIIIIPGLVFLTQKKEKTTEKVTAAKEEPSPTQEPVTAPSVSLKVALAGVNKLPVNPNLNLTLVVKEGMLDQERTFNGLVLKAADNGIFSGRVKLTGVPTGSGYKIIVKTPIHLPAEFCENEPSTSECTSGNITLEKGLNELDFSKVPLIPGDLGNQDNTINATDVTLLRQCLLKSDEVCLQKADLNFDGVVNTADLSLVMSNMQKSFQQTESTVEKAENQDETIPTESEEDIKIINGVYIYPDYE